MIGQDNNSSDIVNNNDNNINHDSNNENINDNDYGNDDNDNDKTTNVFFNRLEIVLRGHGLTPFSSKIALAYIQKTMNKDNGNRCLARVMQYLLDKMNNKQSNIVIDNAIDWQKGCPNRIPNLTSSPIWDKEQFSWVKILESSYCDIKSEFLSLRNSNVFQPYRSPISENPSSSSSSTSSSSDKIQDELGEMATDKGSWNVCYLYLHGMDFEENLLKCPSTTEVMKSIPRLYEHAFFSALAPNTHITPHYGPTNKKLRCHLPLSIPEGDVSWLRVGDRRVLLTEGESVIFDDSFEHEAGNDSTSEPRVILVIDIWHPDLTDEELYFFKFVNNSQMNAAKKIAKIQGYNESNRNEDFFTVISNARRNGVVPSEEIWGYKVNDD